MTASSLTLLTPAGALVGLAALVPLAAALYGRKRAEAVGRGLRLPAPARGAGRPRLYALAGALLLLGLAATQPALTRSSSRHVRRDAQALFVLDTSRSMAASDTATSPTRLDRAIAAASRLRAAIPQVEAGVATLTDRVLPDLLPVGDVAGFDAVVSRTVAIDSPPPRETSVRATSYGALAAIPAAGYFSPTATRRVVVLLTDGESAPTDTGAVAQAFAAHGGYELVAVRFWGPDEAVYGAQGRPDAAYRPDPSGRAVLAALASATGGRAFEEDGVGSAAAALRDVVGRGPTVAVPGTERTTTLLAPYLVGLSLLVLAVLAALPAVAALRARHSVAPGISLSAQ